jgi:hypothetical protein
MNDERWKQVILRTADGFVRFHNVMKHEKEIVVPLQDRRAPPRTFAEPQENKPVRNQSRRYAAAGDYWNAGSGHILEIFDEVI